MKRMKYMQTRIYGMSRAELFSQLISIGMPEDAARQGLESLDAGTDPIEWAAESGTLYKFWLEDQAVPGYALQWRGSSGSAGILSAIRRIVDYSWQAEQRDYGIQDAGGKAGHIFNDLRAVDAWLGKGTRSS